MDPLLRSGDSEAGPLSLFEEHILPRGAHLTPWLRLSSSFADSAGGSRAARRAKTPPGESIVKRCATWESAAGMAHTGAKDVLKLLIPDGGAISPAVVYQGGGISSSLKATDPMIDGHSTGP